jgi:hypothetical protein
MYENLRDAEHQQSFKVATHIPTVIEVASLIYTALRSPAPPSKPLPSI